jgi:GTP-binding protein
MDEHVARRLHASGRRTVIAANKADHAGRDGQAAEFERFGFPVFPVSALHDRGFDELMQAVLCGLPPAPPAEAVSALKVTIVGRPNVGKSSFVNRVLRSDRVIVSPVPGTTRDSIDIPFSIGAGALARHYILTDTAGIRPVQKVGTSVETFSVMRAEQSIERADVVVLVLDAVQGPTAQDKKIASLILEHERGCVLVVNKWDLAEGTTQTKYAPALYRAVPFMRHCPVVFVSAKTGYNIRGSVEAVDNVASQTRATLPTGVLNRAILDAAARVSPPSVSGRWLKIFYATQVGTAPVRVRMFVNDPKLVSPAYRDYLIRCLREKFGLEGAPVRLLFMARPRKERASRRGESMPAHDEG